MPFFDCDRCRNKNIKCNDCSINFINPKPHKMVYLRADESKALTLLIQGGLVPPIQYDDGEISDD